MKPNAKAMIAQACLGYLASAQLRWQLSVMYAHNAKMAEDRALDFVGIPPTVTSRQASIMKQFLALHTLPFVPIAVLLVVIKPSPFLPLIASVVITGVAWLVFQQRRKRVTDRLQELLVEAVKAAPHANVLISETTLEQSEEAARRAYDLSARWWEELRHVTEYKSRWTPPWISPFMFTDAPDDATVQAWAFKCLINGRQKLLSMPIDILSPPTH